MLLEKRKQRLFGQIARKTELARKPFVRYDLQRAATRSAKIAFCGDQLLCSQDLLPTAGLHQQIFPRLPLDPLTTVLSAAR